MEVELLKLIPGGGSVLATLIVVVLFLKQQEKINAILNTITDKFNAQTVVNQKAYQDQITAMTAQSYVNQKAYQDQIKGLIDDHMIVTRETVAAVKSLEGTVNNLQIIVQRLDNAHQQSR